VLDSSRCNPLSGLLKYDFKIHVIRLLMIRFYQLWRAEGRSPAQALAEARRELREEERFRHPFY